MISTHDESLLGWYFGQGQCAFERSTVGAMLEHAEMFGNSHIGWAFSAREGTEVVQFERLRRDPTPWGRVHDGEIVYSGREVTARPTAEVRQAGGYTPNLRDMEMHAEATTVLRVIERRSWRAVAVLQCWFGDVGAQWAKSSKPGRLGALYHLTSAGERLLEQSAADASAKGQPVAGSPAQRMQNEVAARVATKANERRRVRLLQCEKQALLLRVESFAAWCDARSEVKSRSRLHPKRSAA